MSELDSLIKSIPLDQVADALGVDRATADHAVAAALPTIIAGLQRNASTEEGADELANAVAEKDPAVLKGLNLHDIDVADGEKILGHIFGGETNEAATAVAAQLSGADVLGSVLGQVLGGASSGGSGSVWGNVLGQVLSGGKQAPEPKSDGESLDDLLRDVLGQGGATAPGGSTPQTPTAPTVEPSAGSELAKKLLPILAPIVLAWLAQQAMQKGGQVNRSNGGLLQEILGGLLTGAGQGASQQGTGSVVTDILGQILKSR